MRAFGGVDVLKFVSSELPEFQSNHWVARPAGSIRRVDHARSARRIVLLVPSATAAILVEELRYMGPVAAPSSIAIRLSGTMQIGRTSGPSPEQPA